MNAWLRQHRYALGITLRRMLAQPFSSLANLLVMALALAAARAGRGHPGIGPAPGAPALRDAGTAVFHEDGRAPPPPGAAQAVADRIRKDYSDEGAGSPHRGP